MIVLHALGVAFAAEPPAPTPPAEPPPAAPAPPAPPAGSGSEVPGYALSVGTGPRPLNTLTLGLTGLGARLLLPAEGLYPWFGLAYNSVSVSNGEDAGRYVVGASTFTISGGVRGNLGDGTDFQGVDPYLTSGLFVNRVGTREGEPDDDDWYRWNGVTFGLTGAFGIDGFLTPNVSVGLELGGTLGTFSGGPEDEDSTSAFVLSTLSAAQLTVWK